MTLAFYHPSALYCLFLYVLKCMLIIFIVTGKPDVCFVHLDLHPGNWHLALCSGCEQVGGEEQRHTEHCGVYCRTGLTKVEPAGQFGSP